MKEHNYFKHIINTYHKAQQIGTKTPQTFNYTLTLYRECERYMRTRQHTTNKKQQQRNEIMKFIMNDLERIITET